MCLCTSQSDINDTHEIHPLRYNTHKANNPLAYVTYTRYIIRILYGICPFKGADSQPYLFSSLKYGYVLRGWVETFAKRRAEMFSNRLSISLMLLNMNVIFQKRELYLPPCNVSHRNNCSVSIQREIFA